MRILVLGNSFQAKLFYKYFSEDVSNIVFTTIQDEANYFEFVSGNDIVEFSCANEIDLVLIVDEKYILSGVEEKLNEEGISVFAPSKKALKIIISKAESKRFMHKAKIKTPKFFIAQKPQFAFDYLKENSYPFAIKPEKRNFIESIRFVEMQKDAKKVINDYFNCGNEKVIIEDYIEGRNIEVWALSTGYSAKIIGINAKYQNEVAIYEPNLISSELKEEIFKNIVEPVINLLSEQNSEYMGIIGFDIIITYKGEVNLVGFNSFFDEISAPLYIDSYNWQNIMDRTIVGDVFLECNFKQIEDYKLAVKFCDNDIELISAKTKNNLLRYIKELEIQNDSLKEALKIWKK